MTFGDDMVSGCVVKRAAKRIHDAGGCDVQNGYRKGYDDVTTPVLDILVEGDILD